MMRSMHYRTKFDCACCSSTHCAVVHTHRAQGAHREAYGGAALSVTTVVKPKIIKTITITKHGTPNLKLQCKFCCRDDRHCTAVGSACIGIHGALLDRSPRRPNPNAAIAPRSKHAAALAAYMHDPHTPSLGSNPPNLHRLRRYCSRGG